MKGKPMKIFEAWKKLTDSFTDEQQQLQFWNAYYATETEAYKKILLNPEHDLKGSVADVAKSLDMEPIMLAGFLDGANTSLKTAVELEKLDDADELDIAFDMEKLYYNMITAKAKWLYNLQEWDGVLTAQKRDEILRKWRSDHTAVSNKVGRNDPCPCGSGKKYKNCCG